MLVIRLFRVGKTNQPVFKVVVTEKSHGARSGRFVEEIGFYNPLTKEKNFKADRVKYWINNGAQASDTVHNLLVSEKIIEEKKRKIAITKSKKEKEPEQAKPMPKELEKTEIKKETPVETKPEEPDNEEKPVEAKPEEPKNEETPAPKKTTPTEPEKKNEAMPKAKPEKETEEVKKDSDLTSA